MPNTVIALKKSATPSASPTSLSNGELAINFADGKLFYKNATGQIVSITSGTNSFGTVNANNTLVVADSPGSIVSIVSGTNINVTGDAINDKITINLNENVVIPSTGTFRVATVGNDEGGEIKLGNAVTNSVLAGDIIVDIFQNKLRFFESAGTNRGAFINLAAASVGVGTDLLAAASSTDALARATASQAFDKANNALANTDGITFGGTLNVTQNVSADKFIGLNNGNGENFKVGDDAWIGDTNLSDTIRIKGQQNPFNAFIALGNNDGVLLGRSGSGPLIFNGQTIWHAGNDGIGSGLDADLLDGQNGTYYGIASDVTAAFLRANTANITADRAWNHANAAFATANIAFANANTVMISAQAAFTVANSGFIHANSGYAFANSIAITANLAFAHANAAFANGNVVIQTAQSAFTQANLTFIHANAAFNKANTANITADRAWNHANAAFITANAAFANANIVMISAQSAFTVANSGFLHANAVYAFANAAYAFANSAHAIANQAFNKANSVMAISEVAPSSPAANTLWWNSGTGSLYVYYNDGSSSQWVQVGGGGTGSGSTGTLLSRTPIYCNTSSLLDGTSENLNVATFKTFTLMKIVTTQSAWVRLYSDGDSRTQDESRAINTDPSAGTGLLAEFVTTANTVQKVTPFLYCGNLEDIPTSNIYVRVTNLSGTTATINIGMTIMGLES